MGTIYTAALERLCTTTTTNGSIHHSSTECRQVYAKLKPQEVQTTGPPVINSPPQTVTFAPLYRCRSLSCVNAPVSLLNIKFRLLTDNYFLNSITKLSRCARTLHALLDSITFKSPKVRSLCFVRLLDLVVLFLSQLNLLYLAMRRQVRIKMIHRKSTYSNRATLNSFAPCIPGAPPATGLS
jgi:hypothetical protein